MERHQIALVCLSGAAQGDNSPQPGGGKLEGQSNRQQGRICAHCEFFDGGGQRRVEQARKTGDTLGGDCLNPRSPRFETKSDQTCPVFFLDSTMEGKPWEQ